MKAGSIRALDQVRVGLAVRTGTVMFVLMSFALAYWLWFSIDQRSIDGPDSISMLAARGILDEGLPRLPSGFLYQRGYIPNYLLAGSFLIFGVNHLASALPSLVMALGTMWLVYLLASRVLGNPWLGVVAAAILIVLQVQTFYATGPRMYMALEFFTVLASYSAWRGYIEGSIKFQFVTAFAVSAALLSNTEAAFLLLAIPAAWLAVMLTSRRPIPRLVSPATLAGALLIGAAVYFTFIFSIPDSVPPIAYDDGRAGEERIGLTLDVLAWGKHLVNYERAFPYGLALFPLTLSAVFLAGVKRQLGSMSGPLYMSVLVIVPTILLPLSSEEVFGTRLWLFILPFQVLLFCLGGEILLGTLGLVKARTPYVDLSKLRLVLLLLMAGVFMSFILGFVARGSQFLEIVREGYGVPCQGRDCDKYVKTVYENLRKELRPDDVVVSSRADVTYHYLTRVDFLLRKKTSKVEVFTRDEHLGVPVIDGVAELRDLLNSDQRVWVIAHSNVKDVLEEPAYRYLDDAFDDFQSNELITVYVNSRDVVGQLQR